jgi:hypothetical protein
MRLNKEGFPLLLLAQSIQLQHLNQALRSLLLNAYLKLKREQLNTDVKVAKDVIDKASNIFLIHLNNLVEAAKQVVVDVKEKLDAPLLFVGEHSLDQLVRLVDDSVFTKLHEGELLGFDEGLDNLDGVLV